MQNRSKHYGQVLRESPSFSMRLGFDNAVRPQNRYQEPTSSNWALDKSSTAPAGLAFADSIPTQRSCYCPFSFGTFWSSHQPLQEYNRTASKRLSSNLPLVVPPRESFDLWSGRVLFLSKDSAAAATFVFGDPWFVKRYGKRQL